MQNEKIIQVIAEYLERNTLITSVSGENPFECKYQFAAEQIAAAISPHLEAGAGWEDAPEWAGWRIEYSDGSHNFSKGYPSIITDGVIKVECRPK